MTSTDPFKKGPAQLARLPRIVRLYILHAMIGFGLAAIFTGMILGLNVANIRHLVFAVEGGWLAGVVFFMLNGIVFAGVQTGITVMSMDYPEDRRPPRGPKQAVLSEAVVPIRADQRRRLRSQR